MEWILQMRQVSKRFPGVLALDNVDFNLARGEVHGLLGENGAGKSTLVKIITGAYIPDSGEINIEGLPVAFEGPADSAAAGVGMIYQEFSLVNTLSVAENILLGDAPKRGFRIDWQEMNATAAELLHRFDVSASPYDKVGDLGVATRQMIEILKVLRRSNLKILIMDEPTSSLTESETKTLFGFIDRLKSEGTSIIYISHRMDEISRICDRVTIFRNGQKIITEQMDRLTVTDIVTHMLGSELANHYPVKATGAGEALLTVDGLAGTGFADISLKARRGEVLGITGLVGAGKTELVETIFGARDAAGGSMTIDGVPFAPKSPRDAILRGMGLLPESRKEQGLVLVLSGAKNVSLSSLDKVGRPFLSLGRESQIAAESYERLEVRPNDPRNPVVNLSGGNQQKVVLAKWLMRDCRVLLFDEPTRGIDVGAKFQIYSTIVALAEQGNAVIVASSEIEEICGICNRVLAMRNGAVVAEFQGEQVNRETVLKSISGGMK